MADGETQKGHSQVPIPGEEIDVDDEGNLINIQVMDALNISYKENPSKFVTDFKFRIDVLRESIQDCEERVQENECTEEELTVCVKDVNSHLYFIKLLVSLSGNDEDEEKIRSFIKCIKVMRRSSPLFKKNSETIDASKFNTEQLLPMHTPGNLRRGYSALNDESDEDQRELEDSDSENDDEVAVLDSKETSKDSEKDSKEDKETGSESFNKKELKTSTPLGDGNERISRRKIRFSEKISGVLGKSVDPEETWKFVSPKSNQIQEISIIEDFKEISKIIETKLNEKMTDTEILALEKRKKNKLVDLKESIEKKSSKLPKQCNPDIQNEAVKAFKAATKWLNELNDLIEARELHLESERKYTKPLELERFEGHEDKIHDVYEFFRLFSIVARGLSRDNKAYYLYANYLSNDIQVEVKHQNVRLIGFVRFLPSLG